MLFPDGIQLHLAADGQRLVLVDADGSVHRCEGGRALTWEISQGWGLGALFIYLFIYLFYLFICDLFIYLFIILFDDK